MIKKTLIRYREFVGGNALLVNEKSFDSVKITAKPTAGFEVDNRFL